MGPNKNLKIIKEHVGDSAVLLDIVEPHKLRQGSITIIKRSHGTSVDTISPLQIDDI